jgi:hypothetical protein
MIPFQMARLAQQLCDERLAEAEAAARFARLATPEPPRRGGRTLVAAVRALFGTGWRRRRLPAARLGSA